MANLASRIAKFALYTLLIYLITLVLFLIDTARITSQTRSFVSSLSSQIPVNLDVERFARNLNRYSHSLDSVLLIFPSLLLGDRDSIPQLGRALDSGSRALIVLSPLIENDVDGLQLSDTQRLARNARLLDRASGDISTAFSEFSSVKFSGFFSNFNPELQKLQGKTKRYEEVFNRAAPLLPILPDLLGNFRKRTYFVAMQNSAQARGTGGLIGTFALVSVDKGAITLDYVAPNSKLEIQPDIPIDVPAEYRRIYQDYAKSWNGSNFSPHFPYAAQIWAETWRRMTGQEVDGVISIDTFMLRALLAASGPVEIDGYQINRENVIEELLSNAYRRYESDPEKRKNYLANLARIIAERFITGNYSKITLLREAIDPILDNRFYFYSTLPQEAQYVELSPLSGILDDKPNNEYRLVLQNVAGNKLDYYLARELTVMSEQCSPIRTSRVDFTVSNTADADTRLPAYVSALRAQGFPEGDRNAQFIGIFLYGPTDARITGVIDVDTGKSYGLAFTERNRALYSVQVKIPAGGSKRFSAYFEGGTGALTTVVQPLVLPQKTIISDSCPP